MQYLKINGKKKLSGDIKIHGAKNSVLPILSACILINGVSVIRNVPKLSDVEWTIKILSFLGCKIKREDNTLIVDSSSIVRYDIPEELMLKMRSSILFSGALLSRQKSAALFLPGGCEIGLRPIDIHIKGLKELGYGIFFNEKSIFCTAENAKSNRVVFGFPSVGATENLILASVFLKGRTTLVNAAREPEIADLVSFLNSAGAKIRGEGTPIIEIEGVKSLKSVEHTVIPDRILASTIMSAAAISGGDVLLNSVKPSHLAPVIPVFDEMGCRLYVNKSSIRIIAVKRLLKVKRIETSPFPGFPTDSQSPLCAALTLAKGRTQVYETIFENRFKYMQELCRFGADITVNERTAVINGVKNLHASNVKCTDLRGGAAVVIAALGAEGESNIFNISHLDRGYESIENQLSVLGADIKRKDNEKEGR